MNTNMKGTRMDEIENTMARCMAMTSIPQSNPAAARVSEMVTRYVQKFGSARLEIYRLPGASNEELRRYLNALRITLLRKRVQTQYIWQYDPAQSAYLLFLCHYDSQPEGIRQIASRLWHGSFPLQTINSIPINQYNLHDIDAWLSKSFSAIPASSLMTPFYQHTFGYSRSL